MMLQVLEKKDKSKIKKNIRAENLKEQFKGPTSQSQFPEDKTSWAWWRTPLIPELKRQGQADLCEPKASLSIQ